MLSKLREPAISVGFMRSVLGIIAPPGKLLNEPPDGNRLAPNDAKVFASLRSRHASNIIVSLLGPMPIQKECQDNPE
jgi:hypothetical protein